MKKFVQAHEHYLLFNTPNGHRVLNDLINAFDTSHLSEDSSIKAGIMLGRRQVIDYIRNRLKQIDKKIYADIIFEVNSL